MKYRNPETGEVFEDIDRAYSKFCCGRDCDTECPLDVFKECGSWSTEHPAEAARMMGLVKVEDENPCLSCNVGWGKPDTLDKTGEKCFESCERLRKWREAQMEKMDKPLICEVLGGKDDPLDVGEEFHVYGNSIPWHINENGRIVNGAGKECVSDVLYLAINHPDRIIRKPRFSQEEVAVLRHMAAAGITSIEKKAETHLYWDGVDCGGVMVVPAAFLASLRAGQSVKLEDILGGVS